MHEMFRVLVAYARTFERCLYYKEEMGLRREDVFNHTAMTTEIYEACIARRNPYRYPRPHPVELGLEQAKEALVADDMAAFKEHRRNVLSYLERQYWRIERACFEITEFVKYEKYSCGLFSVKSSTRLWKHRYDKKKDFALILLEDYVKSFERDAPLSIRAQILVQRRENPGHWAVRFAPLDRQAYIDKLTRNVSANDSSDFLSDFRLLTDLCDDQYLEIRAARKELFKFDLSDEEKQRCGIFKESLRCAEKIDWGVNEPNLTPEHEPYCTDSDDMDTNHESAETSSPYDDEPEEHSDQTDIF